MQETVFQKIINNELPAEKVYETDTTLSFLSIDPINKGHALVIPKTPVKDIFELSDTDAPELMKAIVTVAKAVKQATGAPGVNVIANNGAEAGQEVFHLHFHIVPRFAKDEFPPLSHTQYTDDEERKSYAERIRSSHINHTPK